MNSSIDEIINDRIKHEPFDTFSTNKKIIIKFSSVGYMFIFGRNANNKPICIITSGSFCINLGEIGECTYDNYTLTCKLGTYACGVIMYDSRWVESISYE